MSRRLEVALPLALLVGGTFAADLLARVILAVLP